jgi:putative membrane protein
MAFSIKPKKSCFIILIALSITGCAHHDSVKIAKEIHYRNTVIDNQASLFLIETADIRRFILELGTFAEKNSTSAAIRQYGNLMKRDQTEMLQELNLVATNKKITLPLSLSNERTKILNALEEKKEGEFDKRFIKQITADLRHDLMEFEKATVFEDRYVRIFAKHYITMIQNHLKAIEAIKGGDTIRVVVSN